MTERFTPINFGMMEMEMPLDDRKTYAKPWTFKALLKLNPDTELIEDVCENEKDVQHLTGE